MSPCGGRCISNPGDNDLSQASEILMTGSELNRRIGSKARVAPKSGQFIHRKPALRKAVLSFPQANAGV
jgi:hypothetical protein